MKLLAFADLHMGAGTDYGRAPYGPGSRLADQQAALDAIVDLAISEDVAAVLFAGDMTHHNKPTPGVLRAIQEPLERLAGEIPIISISGNSHDVASTDEPIALELFSSLMTIRRRPGIVDLDDVAIACLPWAPPHRLAAGRDAGGRGDVHAEMADHLVAVAAGMRAEIGDRPAILMLHYSISGGVSASGADAGLFTETVLPLGELVAQRWDAVIAGHLHRYQVLSEDPLVVYPGTPAVVDFGEQGQPHGCLLLEIA